MRLAVYYDLASGGAANALELYVRFLRSRNHEVDVFHPQGAHPIAGDSAALPGLAPPKPPSWYYGNRLSQPRYYARLDRQEQEWAARLQTYDRVLVHSCRGRGAPALLRYLGERAVFYVTEPLRLYREPRPPDGEPYPLWKGFRLLYTPVSAWLNRRDAACGRAARTLVVNSRYTRGEARAVYGQDAEVVYPPVHPVYFEENSAGDPEDYILSPGAMIPPKGHGRVIRAVARLAPPRPRVVLAGSPVDRRYVARLSALARELQVSLEVEESPGAVRYRERMRGAAAVAVGAWREPLGLVSLEAQALGRPVVVVREGGLPETMFPGNAHRVVSAEPEGFSRGLQDALDNRSADGADASRWVKDSFSPEACGTRLEIVLCK